MTALLLLPFAMAALVGLGHWRSGLLLCIWAGVLQDPLRKIAPNQPVYFVVLVGLVFGASWLGAREARVPKWPKAIEGWPRYMGQPFRLFVLLVLLQAVNSYVRYANLVVTGIGLMVWLAPVPAVTMGYQFALRGGISGLRRWMVLYCAVALVSLAGIYLEFSGFDWAILGEIGPGQEISNMGSILKAYSGFFRSSEIAAWHVATVSACAFMLFTSRRMTVTYLLGALALIAVLVSLGVLTGRRKMLVEVAMFLGTYVALLAWFRHGAPRLAIGAALAGVLSWGAVVGLMNPDMVNDQSGGQRFQVELGGKFGVYAARGQTVFGGVGDRFANLGVAPMGWAVNNFGWFGAGLGTGSQQGFGREDSVDQIDRGAAEGGLGKITMELGVPGLLLVAWLLVSFARLVNQGLAYTTRTSLPHANTAYGLLALLVAKAASFSVAAQAYSDLFVLIIMGSIAGFLLAMPVLTAEAVSTGE